MSRHPVALALLILGVGCGGGGGGTEPPDGTRNLAVQEGNGQNAAAGTTVAIAPAVKVSNGSGTAVAGAQVNFAVSGGGGSVSGGAATSDGNGVARVGSWTLGQSAGSNSLVATVQGGSASVTFSATGVAGPAALLSKQAGDNQTGSVFGAVTVAPAVKVSDQFGNPVAGAVVSFAVASGGGSVTGGTQSSGADGIARVGSWTLGAVGPNTLTATLGGAGASVTFTATGQEVLLQPSRDTTITGSVSVTRFIVPANIVVTVSGTLLLNAAGEISISGTVRGNCTGMRLEAGGLLTLLGTLDNGCSDPAADGANLLLIGHNGYELNGATVATDGDFDLTSDLALIAASGPAAAGLRAPLLPGSVGQFTCGLQNTELPKRRPKARNGADLPVSGANGLDGHTTRVLCGGNLAFRGGVVARGQHGGDGGKGSDRAARVTQAKGGKGGKGGFLLVYATGVVSFAGSNTLSGGDGGAGGNAEAESQPVGTGLSGPNAKATGGEGGEPGLFEISSDSEIRFFDPTTLGGNGGGNGGDALALGADGVDATASAAAQQGGAAEAEGGLGASTPDRALIRRGSVVNEGLAHFVGADGGRGGDAEARAGNGGKGSLDRPGGGNGGSITARGGAGGEARLSFRLTGPVGDGGNGGTARFVGGNGGRGWRACPPLNAPGGKGGDGGSLAGHDGVGAFFGGHPGGIELIGVGNGGNGGDGHAPGFGGQPGTAGYSANGSVVRSGPWLSLGDAGSECLVAGPSSTITGFVQPAGPCPPPFPVFINNLLLLSAMDEPMTLSFSSPHPGFFFSTLTAVIPPHSALPGIKVFWNQCAFTPNTATFIRVTATHASGTLNVDLPVLILP